MQKERLVVSETFYSLQGEGPCCGQPALFLRLAGCNLACAGFSYQDPISKQHLGCDTKLVWQQGKPYSPQDLINHWQEKNWLGKFSLGAHLVITGGEPLLQQNKIIALLQQLDESIFIEIETNATVLPNEFLSKRINQFNVSPKLTFSLEPRNKAYQPEVLKHFAKLPQAIFKFVIQTEADVAEVIKDYQQAFSIAAHRIWLMPEGGSLKAMQPKMAMVAECCKRYGFNFSPRLHIHIWDEATGV